VHGAGGQIKRAHHGVQACGEHGAVSGFPEIQGKKFTKCPLPVARRIGEGLAARFAERSLDNAFLSLLDDEVFIRPGADGLVRCQRPDRNLFVAVEVALHADCIQFLSCLFQDIHGSCFLSPSGFFPGGNLR